MNKKKIATIIMILAVSMILFFTFQDAEGTTRLSESVRQWLGNHGIELEPHALRSNVHILEYFLLGIAGLAFGESRGWKVLTSAILCCGIGLMDEVIKIWIPTREFDVVDLIKDWIGIGIAAAIKSGLNIRAKER